MCDRIDEAVVLLIETNLSDQEAGVENDPRGDSSEKHDAENNFQIVAPVKNDPAAAYSKGKPGQADSQAQEEKRRLAARYAHGEILPLRAESRECDKVCRYHDCSIQSSRDR